MDTSLKLTPLQQFFDSILEGQSMNKGKLNLIGQIKDTKFKHKNESLPHKWHV